MERNRGEKDPQEGERDRCRQIYSHIAVFKIVAKVVYDNACQLICVSGRHKKGDQ
jgi:hypothetical protein